MLRLDIHTRHSGNFGTSERIHPQKKIGFGMYQQSFQSPRQLPEMKDKFIPFPLSIRSLNRLVVQSLSDRLTKHRRACFAATQV
jgi:hypothetical protein